MMISEGLAENFATSMFGEDMVGPWVSKTDMDTLNNYMKPLIKDALGATGLENISGMSIFFYIVVWILYNKYVY